MTELTRIAVLLVGVAILASSLVGVATTDSTGADDRNRVDGTVVDTDPVRLETGRGTLTITNAESLTDDPVRKGDVIDAYGTYEGNRTMRAVRLLHRRPWEFHYVYGISVLGGAWVLVRFARTWTFDVAALGFAPRSPGDRREGN